MRTIALEGMQFYAFHGFYDEEQIIGNQYIIDIAIGIDFPEKLEDDLTKTINYETVYLLCKQVMVQPVRLLETLLDKIFAKIKLHFKDIRTLSIKIRKLNPPLGGQVDAAVLEDKYDFTKICPSCGKNLSCYKSDSCWCFSANLSEEQLSNISDKFVGCLCPTCLEAARSIL